VVQSGQEIRMNKPPRILVINPNSTDAVTRGLDAAMECYRPNAVVECVTLKEGPPGIENQQHVDGVIAPLMNLLRQREDQYDAFVIACYSDPGLHSLRELTKKPVLGIAECGLLTAMTMGQRIGVIAILQKSIPRHLRYLAGMGISQRLVAELPLDMGVVELSQEDRTMTRLAEVGHALRAQHGADVVVLGCAGMANYRARLQEAIGVPVVDPSQAATGMAIARVALGWHLR
jgi:allantoin racemase